jgi:hypothetical protein
MQSGSPNNALFEMHFLSASTSYTIFTTTYEAYLTTYWIPGSALFK